MEGKTVVLPDGTQARVEIDWGSFITVRLPNGVLRSFHPEKVRVL